MPDVPIELRNGRAVIENHSRRFADFTFVYPVISRRSGGLSIGVNVNPDKVCNFDCVYCEVDRRVPGKVARVDLPRMRDELGAMIRFVREGGLAREPGFCEVPLLAREIKDIAFSGDGEPTMIHNFAECVEAVAGVRADEGLAGAKIVLITDAAGLDKADVRRGLEIMDRHNGVVWGKLDAGTEAYFKSVGRTSVPFARILSNLTATARLRPIVIQTMLLKMHGVGMDEAELESYCARLNEMTRAGAMIREVQAYTVARPVPEPFVSRVPAVELHATAVRIRERTGLMVRAFE